jgi:hypothetical protein
VQEFVFERIESEILDKVFGRDIGVGVVLNPTNRRAIKTHYESTREFVRSQMLLHGKRDFLIDRHKVASCLLWGVLKARPFNIPEGDQTIMVRLANERAALSAAVAVIQSFMRTEAKEKADVKITALCNKSFKYPETYFETSDGLPYPYHVYRAMYQAKQHDKFEPFVWANLLFVLEKYNVLYQD